MSRPDEEALAELRPSEREEASDWELNAAPEGTSVTGWRFVIEDGDGRATIDVQVTRKQGLAGDLLWCAEGRFGNCSGAGWSDTIDQAIADLAQSGDLLLVVEILAPGERSRAELSADRADVIAQAVAEERSRCVARVRDLASDWEWKGEPDIVVALDDLAEELEQGVPQ